MARTSSLLDSLRRELARVADPARAPAMQAYMKSAMPFHGVPAPLLRKTCKQVFADLSFDAAGWQRLVRELWCAARFREERYAAVALTEDRRARDFQTLDALPLYEELIVTGAWWDFVDQLASHGLGRLLANHPREMKQAMRAWSRSDDLWKRRSAIICQLGCGADTDLELLYDCIEPALGSRELFLRKAIGWALRQYARTNPDEVVRYVDAHVDELSGLSKREALKHVGN